MLQSDHHATQHNARLVHCYYVHWHRIIIVTWYSHESLHALWDTTSKRNLIPYKAPHKILKNKLTTVWNDCENHRYCSHKVLFMHSSFTGQSHTTKVKPMIRIIAAYSKPICIMHKYLSTLRTDSIIFIRCQLTVTNGQCCSHVSRSSSFLVACFLKAV